MSTILFTFFALVIRIVSNPLANVCQKKLISKNQHPLIVNFFTYLFLSIVCLVVAPIIRWPPLLKDFWLYSVLGGIAGAAGNGFLVKALQKGDLSVLGPINAYKSVVGIIVGIILLGELPNAWGLLGTALIIGGSYFVLDTTDAKFSLVLFKQKEIQYRTLAMVLTAIEAVFIKRVILASNVTVSFFSWCSFGAIFSFLLLPVNKLRFKYISLPHTSADISSYVLLFFCIGAMQLTTNFIFEHMPVGYALALFQLSTIISVYLGYRFFSEKDIGKKLLGSIIMMIGSIIIILLK